MTKYRTTRTHIGGAEIVILSKSISPPHHALTPAELEVARLAAAELSNADIARRRRCAVRTVINQIASIFRKLGIESRHHIAAKLEE
jgi:DNA-binding CsgD family transcriptional regulator